MTTRTDTTVRSVLCPTCACSFVRLGVTREQATHAAHDRTVYFFCCEGCADTFRTNPDHYLARIVDVVVCPVCHGEEPVAMTGAIEHAGRTVHFCQCPYWATSAWRPGYVPDRATFKITVDRPGRSSCHVLWSV